MLAPIFLKFFRRLSLLFLIFLTASCSTNAGSGALIGAGSGAIIGGAAGGGTGALIGASVGLIVGVGIGSYLDQQEQENMRNHPRTLDRMDRGDPLTVDDVIYLHEGGISDETIIQYIRDSRVSYNLTETQIRKLKSHGVSETVINFMIGNYS